MAIYTVEPIGTFRSQIKNPAEAGRQPSSEHAIPTGEIHLNSGQNFEQALIGLESIERIWLLFIFDQNKNWKPMVQPPRGLDHKIGVFATRAPYRPNFIGMSCVRLKKIEQLTLFVEDADLLDGSPILDIKPYLPYCDSYPESQVPWLENIENKKCYVTFSSDFTEQLNWLEQKGLLSLQPFLLNQLEYEPTNSQKKRVRIKAENTSGNAKNIYEIAYRTWRCDFKVEESHLTLLEIRSGYSLEELSHPSDPYLDKNLHRDFLKRSKS